MGESNVTSTQTYNWKYSIKTNMGFRWFLYNQTLDVYYDIGSSSLTDIQHDIKRVMTVHGWTLDQTWHFISDRDQEIPEYKVLGWDFVNRVVSDSDSD